MVFDTETSTGLGVFRPQNLILRTGICTGRAGYGTPKKGNLDLEKMKDGAKRRVLAF